MSWTKPRWWIERNRRRRPESIVDIAFEWINAFLTAFLTIGVFSVSVATWRATERQADVAEALRDLEYAKSRPKFEISASKSVALFKTGLSDREIALPRYIEVKPKENVREITFVNVSVGVPLIDSLGDHLCEVEFTGLYIDDTPGKLDLWPTATDELPDFLMMLEAYGLNIFYAEPRVRVTYVDILGRSQIQLFSLGGGEVSERKDVVPMYSGAMSNGQGFHTDEGRPQEACPSAAKDLAGAIRDAGGGPGRDPTEILRALRNLRRDEVAE